MTKEQAMDCRLGQELHYTGKQSCARTIGPRGGIKESIVRVRVSGHCQIWKTRPEDFRLPVKYGLYESSAVEKHNADCFHLESECPLNQAQA